MSAISVSESTPETEPPASSRTAPMDTLRLCRPAHACNYAENSSIISVRTYLAVFTVCLVYFAQLVNLVGAGAQTQAIAAYFGSSSHAVWISTPLTISTVVLSPIVSQASDYWGRRWPLVSLTLFGSVGSLMVARADSMAMVIAGFTLTGFSYGAQPLLHVIISEIIPRKHRSLGQAGILLSNALGGISALLVGGALIKRPHTALASFRVFWYMTAAIFLLAVVLTMVLYQPPASQRQMTLKPKDKLKRLDWGGYTLLTVSLVLICIGLSWSENPFPWSDPHVAATFGLGIVTLTALCAYETLFKKDGMFHHGLFKNRNFPIALACLFCEGVAFFAANQYFSFEMSVLYEKDQMLVGVRYSIPLAISIVAALSAGAYCSITRRVRWVTVLAFVLLVGFFVGMAVLRPEHIATPWGVSVLFGMGLGFSLCALITIAQLSTPPELIATATGLVISVRSLGGSIGLAIYNTLFTQRMNQMGHNVGSTAISLGLDPAKVEVFVNSFLSHDAVRLSSITGVSARIIQEAADSALGTYAGAFRSVWITAGCFAAVAAIFAAFLEDQRDEFNMQIDAPLEARDGAGQQDTEMK